MSDDTTKTIGQIDADQMAAAKLKDEQRIAAEQAAAHKSAPSIFAQPNVDLRPGAINTVKPADQTAAQRLRAWEDTHIGKKAVRIHGRIERGYGSPFKEMSPEKHAEYAALEKLVEAEDRVDAANVALSNAKVAHDDALAALALAQKASERAAADAKKEADEEAATAKTAPVPVSQPAPAGL